jgi:transposase
VELYLKVRLAIRDGMSAREAARHFGVSRESVKKMLSFSVPPGYRRMAPIKRPKLDGFTEIIDQWLGDDVGRPRKQRHTAKRVFDRLRDEHGFTGGYTIVKVTWAISSAGDGRCLSRCTTHRATPRLILAKRWL